MERTNTEMYRISFGPGETEKPCEGKHSYNIIYIFKYYMFIFIFQKHLKLFSRKGCFDLFDQESTFYVDKTVNECQQK